MAIHTNVVKPEVKGLASSLKLSELEGKIADLEQQLKAKQEEFAPLKAAIIGTQEQITLLQGKIDEAPSRLASGELNTEGVLRLHTEMTTLKNSLQSFQEASEIQDASLEPLHTQSYDLQSAINLKIATKRRELPEVFFGKFDPQAMREFIMVFTAERGGRELLADFVLEKAGTINPKEAHFFAECAALEILKSEI